jgi:mannose-1-phosphate guanylyltransferase
MNWAVVMAGGRGTRFWPESRALRPKPFLNLLGRRTLLEETVNRLSPLFPPGRILLVIQSELVGAVHKLPLLKKIPRENILGEPVGRNTAPCCVWAAAEIGRRDPDAKFVFLPADQSVTPKPLFLKTLKAAFEIVDERPVLLGMRPDSPHTGYGYLEVGRRKRRIHGMTRFTVTRFHEKPILARARRFLKLGNFLWNGGTFVWQLDAFKDAVRKYAPKIYGAWGPLQSLRGGPKGRRSTGSASATDGNLRAGIASASFGTPPRNDLKRIYQKLPSISIDYAVMEKMKNVHCLLASFKWSDLGSWEGLAEFWPADKKGNKGDSPQKRGQSPIFIRARRNLVRAGRRLIALLGVDDLLVVDTPDALLISSRSQTEAIREVVRELERRKATPYL